MNRAAIQPAIRPFVAVSVLIGHELPEGALELLQTEDPRAVMGKIVIVATVDHAGFPHMALLSRGELVAVSSKQVRLVLNAEATTIENIASRSTVTLALIEPEVCCYVKGRGSVRDETLAETSLMPFTARRVDVHVDSVLLDSEARAAIVSGPRYERAVPLEEELAHWRHVHAFLGRA